MTPEELAKAEIDAMARAIWLARCKNATVLDEYFQWYHDGKADPNSSVHYSTIADAYRDATAAHTAALKVMEGAGYVLAPREPTEKMICDGAQHVCGHRAKMGLADMDAKHVWGSMLAAAQDRNTGG